MKTRRIFSMVGALILALAVAGCGGPFGGGNEQSGTDDGNVIINPGSNLAVSDPTNTTLTSLAMTISPEYDAATGNVNIYMLLTDQDGAFFDTVNKYNFSGVMNVNSINRYISIASDNITLADVVSSDSIVCLVIDSSGSMSANIAPSVTRMQATKDAAKLFVGLMGPSDKTALVDFDDDARLMVGLTDNQTSLTEAIDSLVDMGGTNIGGALVRAVSAIGSRPGKRAIVLLTDGEHNGSTPIADGIAAAQDSGIPIFSIALGDLTNTAIGDLQNISTATGGQYFAAADVPALTGVFGVTVPLAISGLDPMRAFRLTVPNPVPPLLSGAPQNVNVITTVRFTAATKTHTASASGAYTVE